MEFFSRKNGFTTIEVIIVIVVMVIIARVAYMKWINKPLVSVAAQAALLADDIRYAQNLSMSNGQHYQFVFNAPSANKYQILDGSSNPVRLSSGLTYNSLSSGITFSSISITPSATQIVFDARGRPYADDAATQPLTAQAVITLSSGNITKTVSVDKETGRVSVT
jgi:prepilin-type N-terminal cleavage/methylation domain-containing protein